jgi:hypothetical protein
VIGVVKRFNALRFNALRKLKAQVSVEYLMLVAGALVLLVALIFLFKGNLFNPTQTDIEHKSDEIHSAIASLQPTSGGQDDCGPKPPVGICTCNPRTKKWECLLG